MLLNSLPHRACLFALTLLWIAPAVAEYPGRGPIDAYLAQRTATVESRCLTEPLTGEQWNAQRPELERQLRDMLGLNPWPERTDLKPTIVDRTEYDGYAVERIHFQSRPGLYVSANLYLPSAGEGPFPTILYVCGHARVKEDGVSYGNKVGYHHHGVWFARHGYVCMMIDTIQLGEIEGIHHGTYSKGMWWWASRGYTPAGVEAWNSMRALDYLETRPEVDAKRFGVTGRSGGGSYSWWTAAIDQRIKAVVPVAGITDMRNHVVDGCIEGHCDCMFMVNRFGWDFATVAAMIAPRALLFANSHRDRIFPLDGVIRTYQKTTKVYEALGALDNVAVHITEGPHKDTQALRVGAFAWFEKHLKNSTDEMEEVARKVHEPQQLQVYVDGIPADQRVTDVQEWFVPAATAAALPTDNAAWAKRQAESLQRIDDVPGAVRNVEGFALQSVNETKRQVVGTVAFRHLEIDSNSPLKSFAITAVPQTDKPIEALKVCIGSPDEQGIRFTIDGEAVQYSTADDELVGLEAVAKTVASENQAVVFLMLQGDGKSRWMETEKETTHLRRRLHLLGQSLDGIRVSEIRSLLELLAESAKGLPVAKSVEIEASGKEACMVMLASLTNADVSLTLRQLPENLADGPILLGLSKAIDLTDLLALAAAGHPLTLDTSDNEAVRQVRAVAEPLGWPLARE
ncbi:Alpha/beta hydrolase family protein [Rosistilla carotiformis]|uniref:Alpha/beta hydrolase family protein n=1 Tax=Rosistilla carotiformis TaxID=2528017 RepID=A0A518JUX3_9BACT|nr:CocE/NonD family hydrolase [Rosistilla carotiformis]QDV69345.1 Alpha/beta hydrolase family protein [Rosistilla carotiformis]